MKIIVISDTHKDLNNLRKVALMHQDADRFFHLGDSEVISEYLSPFISIKGNCDYFSNYPLYKDLEICGLKFHLEHGHFINFTNFKEYVESLKCDVFLFGHLHQKVELLFGNTLVLNPGSLFLPRDSEKPSYLIIYIDEETKELSYEFKYI